MGGCICVCARERKKKTVKRKETDDDVVKAIPASLVSQPSFSLIGALVLPSKQTLSHKHTHTHTPSSLLLPASFSIICLSDACCGRIRADTPVPAATRGCHQHLNIFSLCCFSPFAPLCPCSTPTADKEHREDDK